MTLERRLEVLKASRAHGSLIFEDDYDSEYRYVGRPLPTLQGLDQGERVILAGSFSKVLLPTLRLGYLVVPDALVDSFSAARYFTDHHSSVLDQAAMCEFLTDGHFGRHLRRMRELYSARLYAFRSAVHAELAGVLDIPEGNAGIFCVGWLGDGLSGDKVAAEALRRGVETRSLSDFIVKYKRRAALVLGFAGHEPESLRDATAQLAVAIHAARRSALASC